MGQVGNIKSKLVGLEGSSENKILNGASIITSEVKFDPSQFFIPGWKGEGLVTSHGLAIKSILNNLTIDATALFKKQCMSTQSMRKQIHEEFVAFLDWKQLDKSHFLTPSDFLLHLQDETSPYQFHIQDFIKIFCFRAVAIYLFRIKFILELTKELRLEVNEDNLFNPLSFLGKIFKKNSSTELNVESLQINQYSWYRPSNEYRESVLKIQESFSNVTLTELIKLLSTPKEYKIYSIKNYSHSLSHISYGQFIINLLTRFPKWLNQEEAQNSDHFFSQKSCVLPKTINTLFEGNHVSSLALSHWLSQETNVQKSQWDNIICPDFKGLDFIDGTFLKICQELQFLGFLTKVAIVHGYEVVPFICKIMKEKNSNRPENSHEQFSLLDLANVSDSQSYGRIVLNLIEQPKTNPHHHLVTQILNKKEALKKDGLLIVLTNQKLFVPSHSDRVEQLLKEFKLHAMISLDEVKGKGEIPHYTYILSKRANNLKTNPYLLKINRTEKESCHSFIFKGDLQRFNLFSSFVLEFENFIQTKKFSSTPIYVNDLGEDLSFEFHTDAIIEGKLVSSSHKDQGQQAHPSFFKNLTKTSASFDTFFHFDLLNSVFDGAEKNIASELLGVRSAISKQHQLLLIVNQSNPLKIELELAPIESFKAKVEEYGTAFFNYFGLTPKHSAINLNAFREYFNSNIGNQIIQMQLSDGPSKLKGKLKSLLIPSFFANTRFLNEHEKNSFKFLEITSDELLKLSPDNLRSGIEQIESKYLELKTVYPWHILGLLAHFKLTLQHSIEDINSNKIETYLFSNPAVSKELIKLKTTPIYPKNEDVFLDIIAKKPNDLKEQLASIIVKSEDDKTAKLILKNSTCDVVELYSNPTMIQFLKFLLNKGIGYKISDLLLAIQVPNSSELQKVIENYQTVKDCKLQTLNKVEKMINQIFTEQVTR